MLRGAKGRALAGAIALVFALAANMVSVSHAGASVRTVPTAPTGLVASSLSASQIELAWNSVTVATSYEVLRATSAGGPYTNVGPSSAPNFVDSGLAAATTYYYTVKAVNASGTSAPSKSASATTRPLAPLGVVAKAVSVSEIDLTWAGVHAAVSYSVLRATTSTGPFTPVGSPTTASLADTGLSSGTKYFYEVEAVSAAGPSAPSSVATAITLPAAPTGVVAKAVSAVQINLTWPAVTGAASYVVARSSTSGGPYATVGTPHSAAFSNTALSAATTYYYVVQAKNLSGLSATSPQASTTTAPLAPGGLSATVVSSSQVNLAWSAVSGASGYRVLRSTVSGGPYTNVGSATTTSFADSGLAPATTYFYTVQATNGSAPSARSTQVAALTDPAAPTGVTATAASVSEIDLTWSAVTGATSYVIQRSPTSGGPYTTIGSATSPTFADTGLSPATPYYYVIQATNASGSSASSAEASAVTLLGVPTGVSASSVSPSEIDLAWNAVPGASGYVVQRSTMTGGPYTTVGSPTSASLADTGLTPATPYYYVVKATVGSVSSAFSAEVSATTLLGVPTGVAATAESPSEIDLTWSGVPGATAYTVERSTTSGGPYTAVGSPTSASFASTGLTPATPYYYVVLATAGAVDSQPSTQVSATTLLGVPTGVVATPVSFTEIDLSWSAVTGATGYVVQRSNMSGGPYTTVGSPAGASFANTGLAPGTTYYYVVKATAGAVSSLHSAEVSTTTPLGEPTGVVASPVSQSKINLTWNAVTGATGYVVQRGTTSGGPYTTVGTPTAASFADVGLSEATTYFYVVQAIAGAVTSAASAEVSGLTLPAAPNGVAASAPSDSRINVTWLSVGGATGYVILRSNTSGGPYTTVGSTTTTSFADNGLNPHTTYYYVVEAVDASGSSVPSTQVSATTQDGT
jgi:fibronectin type 3 domain-containing protein